MDIKDLRAKEIIIDIRKNLPSNKNTVESVTLGILLAIVGGFLDAYTFICRGGVFANAETGNMVLVALGITNRNYNDVFMAVLPILSFIIGVFVAEAIKKKSTENYLESSKGEQIILIVEAIVLVIVGFVPKDVPHIFVTVTISFVSSVQISSFRKLVDSPYSTTMCTGNLRIACQSVYLAIAERNKDAYIKSIRYSIIIFSFLIGASLGGILTVVIGVKSIWACSLILIIAKILFNIRESQVKEKNSTVDLINN